MTAFSDDVIAISQGSFSIKYFISTENRRVSPKIFELPTQTSAANQSTGSPSHVTPVYQSNEGMSQFNDANNGYDYKQARNEHEEIGSKSTDAVDQGIFDWF